MKRTLTAVVIREDEGFVALCPEVDVASQGATLEEAKRNLQEAVELFFECASPEEIQKRLSNESAISSLEVTIITQRDITQRDIRDITQRDIRDITQRDIEIVQMIEETTDR